MGGGGQRKKKGTQEKKGDVWEAEKERVGRKGGGKREK